jgi:flagellar basal body-associated protein FliL
MKFETIAILVIGSIVIGILGGFAARSIWIGIGLPVVLIVLGGMWLVVRPSVSEIPKEEEKKEDTTQPRQE